MPKCIKIALFINKIILLSHFNHIRWEIVDYRIALVIKALLQSHLVRTMSHLDDMESRGYAIEKIPPSFHKDAQSR